MATVATSVAGRRSAHRRDWRWIGMWILQSVTAATFAAAGGAKLWATSEAGTLVESVDQALGLGAWLRYPLGMFELVGGVALIDIDAAGLAAAMLSVVTLGGVATHVLVLRTIPALPAAMLGAALFIAWVRRGELRSLVRRQEVAGKSRDVLEERRLGGDPAEQNQ